MSYFNISYFNMSLLFVIFESSLSSISLKSYSLKYSLFLTLSLVAVSAAPLVAFTFINQFSRDIQRIRLATSIVFLKKKFRPALILWNGFIHKQNNPNDIGMFAKNRFIQTQSAIIFKNSFRFKCSHIFYYSKCLNFFNQYFHQLPATCYFHFTPEPHAA